MMKRVLSRLCVVFAALATAGVATAEDRGWEQVRSERGITVWKKELAGSNVVFFRGRGDLPVPIVQAAAVLRNSGREQEWMESCKEARVVEWKSSIDAVIYNRTSSPLPFVSDRDLVVEARTIVLPKERALNIEFRSVKNRRAPEVEGVVRMPYVEGHWKLTMKDKDTTEVEYQIAADPGGAIPQWIANWATEKIPFNTIDKLRAQVKKPGYEHDVMMVERTIDWSAFEADELAKF